MPLEGWDWRQSREDFNRSEYVLAIATSGGGEELRFHEEQIEDFVNSPRVQAQIEPELRRAVRGLGAR